MKKPPEKEKDILNVIIHLISSSRLIIDEPKEYSPMRLFSAAKYLCKLLENTDDRNIRIIIEKTKTDDITVTFNITAEYQRMPNMP